MNLNAGFGAIARALSHRNYGIYTGGNVVSHVGTWVQRVAVGWLTWELTESGAWLGVIAFADLFPTVVLAPLTGAVADRMDRLRLLKITQGASFGQSLALGIFTLSGAMTIELLLCLVAAGGAVLAFQQPARLAIVPSLVPRRDLSAAIGVNSLSFNGARFVGPMISGLLIVQYGVGWAFALNAGTYALFIGALSLLRLDTAPAGGWGPVRNIAAEISEGYAYAARHAGIGPVMLILTFVSVFGRPYVELLPGFADQVFGRGAEGLAWLTSMVGLGAMLGGLWLARRGTVVGLTTVSIRSALILSAALIGFAATDQFWLALPCLACAGFAMIVLGVGEQTLIQSAVDPAMRGRVLGLYGMIGRGAPAIGALMMGGLSGYVGLQWPVLGGAVLCLGAWLWAERRKRVMAAALEVEQPRRDGS